MGDLEGHTHPGFAGDAEVGRARDPALGLAITSDFPIVTVAHPHKKLVVVEGVLDLLAGDLLTEGCVHGSLPFGVVGSHEVFVAYVAVVFLLLPFVVAHLCDLELEPQEDAIGRVRRAFERVG